MNRCHLLFLTILLSALVFLTVGSIDSGSDNEMVTTSIGYDDSRDRGVLAKRRSRRRRKLNNRHHLASRLPVSDDGGGKDEEKGPHHYKHYRCSACVKDKDKREREREELHEAEILEKFEAQTNKGLAEAQSAALRTADTVYDSTQGVVAGNVTIVAPSTTPANNTRRLRLRL